MLDQLIESRSTAKETTRRSGFLVTTFILMFTFMIGGWLYSLYAKDYGLGSGDLELSTLVAPVPVADEEPPPPPEEKPAPKEVVKALPNVDTRTEIIQRIDQQPVKPPDEIRTVQNTVKPPREGIATVVGRSNVDAKNAAPSTYRGEGNPGGQGLGGDPNGTGRDPGPPSSAAPPPPPPPPVKKEEPKKEEPPKVPKKISGGVLNGKATSLPKPPYPAAARAVRASGSVSVQVTINESGSVVAASAVSGHPLLQQAAVAAARQAKFAPTTLSGQAVSVTGVIVYNFLAP